MREDDFTTTEPDAARAAQLIGRSEHIGNPVGDQSADVTWVRRGWLCTDCGVKHWDGDPWVDGCADCGWVA